jgi:hypothetical protein
MRLTQSFGFTAQRRIAICAFPLGTNEIRGILSLHCARSTSICIAPAVLATTVFYFGVSAIFILAQNGVGVNKVTPSFWAGECLASACRYTACRSVVDGAIETLT